MENSICTNDVCDIITQMERYIKSNGIKKEKVKKRREKRVSEKIEKIHFF